MRNFVAIIPTVCFLLISACGSETSKSESLASESSRARVAQPAVSCSGLKTSKSWTETDFFNICQSGYLQWSQGSEKGTGNVAENAPFAGTDVSSVLSLNESSFASNYGGFCKSIALIKSGSAKERGEHSNLMASLDAKIMVDDRVVRRDKSLAAASRKKQLTDLIGQLYSCPAQIKLPNSGKIVKIDEYEQACKMRPGCRDAAQ